MASKERQIRLEDFHISRYTGFLIDQPLLELPKEYAVWHEVASFAAERVVSKTFRQAVDQTMVLGHIEQGIRSVLARDDESIIKSLHGVQQVISKMKSTLSLMHDRVNPSDFFDRLLPFLSGWGGEGSPLPEGLIYTGVSDRPKKVSRRSGAQTSVIQAIDAFLGVQHNESENEFTQHMRNYMPPDHKQFIERIESGPSLRQYVNDSTNDALKTEFENCVDALVAFRSYHLTIVTKYTVVMARRKGILPKLVTGDSNVLGFLKGFRSTTKSSRI